MPLVSEAERAKELGSLVTVNEDEPGPGAVLKLVFA